LPRADLGDQATLGEDVKRRLVFGEQLARVELARLTSGLGASYPRLARLGRKPVDQA